MDRFISLKESRNPKVPEILTFLSKIDENPNSVFFEVANFLNESNAINPTYTLISYQDIINASPLNIRNNDANNDMKIQDFSALSPKDSYRWLYLIASIATRQVTKDVELETAKIDFFFNAFYDFIMNAVNFSETSESQNTPEKGITNKLLFISGLLCLTARIISYANRVSDQITSEIFFNKLVTLIKLPLNRFIGGESHKATISDFSHAEIFELASPIPINLTPIFDLFYDVDIFVKYSVFRFLYHLFTVSPNIDQKIKNTLQSLLVPFYDHYILSPISQKVLSSLCNGDSQMSFALFSNRTFEQISGIIIDFCESTEKFTKACIEKEEQFAVELNRAFRIANQSSYGIHIEKYLQDHKELGKSLEILLCSPYYDFFYVYQTAKILSVGKWKLSNFKIPLNVLIKAPNRLQVEVRKLLEQQGDAIVPDLIELFPSVSKYGSKSNIFFDFLASLLPTLSNPMQIINILISILEQSIETTKNNKEFELHHKLTEFISADSYCFEKCFCDSCLNYEKEYKRLDIDIPSNKSQTSYAVNTIAYKFSSPYSLSSITLNYSLKSNSKFPRVVSLLVCKDEIKDIRSHKNVWVRPFLDDQLNHFYFKYQQQTAQIVFPKDLYATGILIEIAEFWNQSENTICKHQCHHLDNESIFCTECGQSSYISLQITVNYREISTSLNIVDQKSLDASFKESNSLIRSAENEFHSMLNMKQLITSVISSNMSISEKKSSLNDLYNDKIKLHYRKIANSLLRIREIRIHCGKFANHLINHYITADNDQICIQCYLKFIKNCFQFFGQLSKAKTKDDILFLKLIYDSFDITKMLLKYISSDFASYVVDMFITFSKVVPEITNKICDIFISSLPSVNPMLINLLCNLEKIDDENRPLRFKSILPSLIKSISYMDSDPPFSMLFLQPLLSTICTSPALITRYFDYTKYSTYNEWKHLLNKPPSPFFIPLSIFPNDEILTQLLFKCTSENVRESIEQLLKDSSNLSHELYNQIFAYAFKFIDTALFGEIEANNQQYYDLILHLLTYDIKVHHLLLSNFFDRLVAKFSEETEKIISKESDSFIFDPNCGRSIYILFKFIYLFLKSTINLRYVINRKPNLAVNIIADYFKLRSLIFQRSKFLYDTLQMMKSIITQIMCNSFVLIDNIEKLNKKKEKSSYRSSPRAFGRGGLIRPRDEIQLDFGIPIENEENPIYIPDNYYDYASIGEITLEPHASNNSLPENEDDQNQNEEEIKVQNPNGPRIFLKAAVKAVMSCPDIAICEISSFLFPPKKVESIPIILKKWRNHEDFLPGQLSREPIMSDQIGETFRDIRTKFAILLDIHDFMQEENSTELLVDNNIISLNLPIAEVYKRIWVPSRGNSPMEVYCRVTGLDGEATEPMVNSFPSENKNKLPPEVQYGFTTVLCNENGFLPLLESLDLYSINNDQKKLHISKETLGHLVKLFEAFVLVKQNRIEINRLDGTAYIFRLIQKILESKQGNKAVRTSSTVAVEIAMGISTSAAMHAVALTTTAIFKKIITIANALIQEDPTSVKNQQDWVTLILKSLGSSFFRNNENLISPFLSLLPPIAAQSRELMEQVLAYFVNQLIPSGKKSNMNIYESCQSLYTLNGLAEFVMVIPANNLGNIIKDMIIKENFVVDAISELYKLFPPEEPEGRLSEKWKSSLDKPFLPSLLKVLIGMSRCHPKTQELFIKDDYKFIKFLLELEPITSKTNIGEFAGDILKTCEIEPSLCKQPIEQIKTKKKEEAHAKAQAKKEAAINGAKLISPELQAQLDALQDQSLECVICHEGYEFLPDEILGVYVYVNRACKFSSSKSARFNDPLLQFLSSSATCIKDVESTSTTVFNTATYFVCVHPSCHRKATETLDRRHGGPSDTFIEHSGNTVPDLINQIMIMDHATEYRAKPPNNLSSEWEAASLRNSERPCNSIFPLPSISLNQSEYKKALFKFVENFNGFEQRSPKNTVKALIDFKSMMLDIRTHLVLTSLGEKIPLQLGGGSLNSIAAFLPFIINAGHILLDSDNTQSTKTPTARSILERQIEDQIALIIKSKSDVKKEGIVDLMIMSIWLLTLEEWDYLKLDLLKLMINFVMKENNEFDTSKLKSILLFYIMVCRIQTMVKSASGSPVKLSEDNSRMIIGPNSPKTPWIQEFRTKIETDVATVQADWTDFGDELQGEILEVTDLRSLLTYAEVSFNDPEEFIRNCILP